MAIAGVVVGSDKITIVEGVRNGDGTVTITKDEVFTLEKGERHIGYGAMHKRIHDRMKHGISQVVLKASSAGKFTGTQSALLAAELRGVFLSAVPASISVQQEHVKNLSKAGSRTVKDYTKDDQWWDNHFGGDCKKGSREAAFMILSAE